MRGSVFSDLSYCKVVFLGDNIDFYHSFHVTRPQ